MKRVCFLVLVLSCLAHAATVFRVDPVPVMTVAGNVPIGGYPHLLAVPDTTVAIYTDAAGTLPATAYSDSTGGTACPVNAAVTLPGSALCQATTGAQGQFGFWLASGLYYYRLTLPNGTTAGPYPISTATAGVTSLNGQSGAVIVPGYYTNWYTFAQSPGTSLPSGVCSFTLNPLPPGVITGDSVYISGGVGTAEAISLTGVSGNTVTGNCVSSHSGSYVVQSATGGIYEAVNAASAAGGGTVYHTASATANAAVRIPSNVTLDFMGVGSLNYGACNGSLTASLWNGTGGNPFAVQAILIAEGSNIQIRNASITIASGSGTTGVCPAGIAADTGSANVLISHNNVTYTGTNQNGASAINSMGSAQNIRIIENTIAGSSANTCQVSVNHGLGGIFAQGTGLDIGGNIITNGCDDVLSVSGSGATYPNNFASRVVVHDNWVYANQSNLSSQGGFALFDVEDSNHITLIGNHGIDAGDKFTCVAVRSTWAATTPMSDITVANNVCDSGFLAEADSPGSITVSGLLLSHNVWDITSPPAGEDGVTIQQNFYDAVITGDRINNAGRYGLVIDSTASATSARITINGVSVTNSGSNNAGFTPVGINIKNSDAGTAPSSQVTISNSRVVDTRAGGARTQVYAVQVSPNITQSKLIFTNNDFTNNSGTSFTGLGTSLLNYVICGNLTVEAAYNQACITPGPTTVGPANYIATESGVNNAIVGTLQGAIIGTNPVNGQCVIQQLSHTLQAGANTYAFNGLAAVAIKSHFNAANNIGTGYAGSSNAVITLCYNQANNVWLDVAQ